MTERQLACLRLAANGYTRRRIGRVLGCSERSVEEHLRAARHHLGDAENTTHAVALAVGWGIIDPIGDPA